MRVEGVGAEGLALHFLDFPLLVSGGRGYLFWAGAGFVQSKKVCVGESLLFGSGSYVLGLGRLISSLVFVLVLVVQARKRHININFLVRLPLGRPQECPWDKPSFSPNFTQGKPSVSQGQTQLVPGTNPVWPWDNPGDEGRQKKFMC